MKTPDTLPIVATAPHASHELGGYAERSALTEEQLVRYSDYGTAESAPKNGEILIIGTTSRGLGDLNRSPSHANLFASEDFAKPSPNKLWKPGKELRQREKMTLSALHYANYHALIEQATARAIEKRKTLVVSWHNTADYIIGKDSAGNHIQMPDIVLSNLGDENRADSKTNTVSCDPELLEALQDYFAKELIEANILENDKHVHTNYGFFGGYDTQRYSTKRNPKDFNGAHELQALQVEYNTKLTHDQETLKEIPGRLDALRAAFERAIEKVLLDSEIAKLEWRV